MVHIAVGGEDFLSAVKVIERSVPFLSTPIQHPYASHPYTTDILVNLGALRAHL